MHIAALVYLFFLHFVADFLLQSRDMGRRKSEVFSVLVTHLGIQFAVIWVGMMPVIGFLPAMSLSGANALVHGVIDWNIWRLYKLSVYKRDPSATPVTWQYYNDHWFYATIGLDQFLHMSTLAILAGLIL